MRSTSPAVSVDEGIHRPPYTNQKACMCTQVCIQLPANGSCCTQTVKDGPLLPLGPRVTATAQHTVYKRGLGVEQWVLMQFTAQSLCTVASLLSCLRSPAQTKLSSSPVFARPSGPFQVLKASCFTPCYCVAGTAHKVSSLPAEALPLQCSSMPKQQRSY